MRGIRLDERRAVLIAAGLSALLHLLMAGSLPLVLTPDSGEYVRTALDLTRPGAPWSPLNRTPGYPALLFATFRAFGAGAGGILVVQNVLAVASCALLTLAACRLAGPAIGLAAGTLYAIEPWSLALANYALTETATAFCVVLAATLAVVLRPRVAGAVALGVAIAAASLIRPAVVVMVVFFGAAWVLRAARARGRRLALAAVLAASFAATVAPWLAYNASRGVRGFAAGSGWVLWYGVTMFGVLDRGYPIDPDIRAVVDRDLAHGVGDYPITRAIQESGAVESVERGERLGAWARASIAAHPGAYLASLPYALLWQLDVAIPGRPPTYDELPYLLDRLTWGARSPSQALAPNFQNPGSLPGWQAFAIAWHGGVMQRYMRWAGSGALRGLPQVPLFLCALAAVALAALRREWSIVALFAGPLVFVAAHVALLQPIARHALPASTVWYLALAYVLRRARAGLSRRPAEAAVTSRPTATSSPSAPAA